MIRIRMLNLVYAIIFIIALLIVIPAMSYTNEASDGQKTLVTRKNYTIYLEDIMEHEYLVLSGRESKHIIHSASCPCYKEE